MTNKKNEKTILTGFFLDTVLFFPYVLNAAKKIIKDGNI
jgi:hypothetical protein